MRKLNLLVALIALASLAAASSLQAETHSFTLSREAQLNGTTLKPGLYKLELNGGGEALIRRGKEVLVKAPAEVRPNSNGAAGSIVTGPNGELREVRLKNKVVVFVR
ncbi:MAG: hypothetical protein L0212_00840 [Acidobacteria bacterium]|nr:hypothetical protein [Acidobacteriota bacterium]